MANYEMFTTETAMKRLADLEAGLTPSQQSWFAFKVNQALGTPIPVTWDEVRAWAEEAKGVK